MKRLAFALLALAPVACLPPAPTTPKGQAAPTSADSLPVAKATTPPAPPIDIGNGSVMLTEFRENIIAAKAKWLGKRVRFNGHALSIEPDYVDMYMMAVYPAADALDGFAQLQKDSRFIGEGTVAEFYKDGPHVYVKIAEGRVLKVHPKN